MDTYKNWTLTAELVKHEGPYWNTTQVKLFKEGVEKFTFHRNYGAFHETNTRFYSDGKKDYLLYSERYTDISIVDLETFEAKKLNLAGEHTGSIGFCPVDIFIPTRDHKCVDKDHDLDLNGHMPFALVQGCVWGADIGNLFVRVLDLRNLDKIEYVKNKEGLVIEHFLSSSKRFELDKDVTILDDGDSFTINVPIDAAIEL